MLVDSHCHLDFPDFAAEREAVIARARAAGVGTMLTIGTRLDEFAGVRAIAESRRRNLVLGRRPSARGRRPRRPATRSAVGAGRPSQGRRDRRDRARFPLRSEPARHPGACLPRPYRGLAHDRTAADHPCPRGRRRDRQNPRRRTAAARGPALLSERPGLGRGGAGARLLHLDFGDRDLQERRGSARDRARPAARPAAGRDRQPLSRAGAVSRQAQRAGLCRRNGGGRSRAERDRTGAAGGGDHRQFLSPVCQGGCACHV